jgi:hypothetical protein
MDKEKVWMMGCILYLLFLCVVFMATYLFAAAIFVDTHAALAWAVIVVVLVGYLGYRLRVVFDEFAEWLARRTTKSTPAK